MNTIKLITLNAWGGRRLQPLLDFFRAKAGEIDVFCLQEMFDADQAVLDDRHPDMKMCADVFRRTAEALPGHRGSFACFEHDQHHMSLALFVRETLAVRTVADSSSTVPNGRMNGTPCFVAQDPVPHVDLTAGLHRCHSTSLVLGPKTDTPDRMAGHTSSVPRRRQGPKVLSRLQPAAGNESLASKSEGCSTS